MRIIMVGNERMPIPLEVMMAVRLIETQAPEDQIAFCVATLVVMARENVNNPVLAEKGFVMCQEDDMETAIRFLRALSKLPKEPTAAELAGIPTHGNGKLEA